MKGFNFEKNLNHQSQAVESTIAVFENISIVQPTEANKNYINPAFDFLAGNQYAKNILSIQNENGVKEKIKRNSSIIAVSYTHLRAHETRHDLVCRLLL